MFVCFIVQVRILFCRLFKLLIFPISELHIFHFITFCQEKSHVHSVKPIRPFDAINEVRLSLMSHNCYYFFFFFKPSGLQPISATQYLHINTHCLDKELILLGLANNIFLHPDHWVICSGYLKVSFQQWIERERERERTGGLLLDSNCLDFTHQNQVNVRYFWRTSEATFHSSLFHLFPVLLLLSWTSPLFDACLSQIMSAPLGWAAKCDPPTFFCASTPSSTSCLFSSSPLHLVSQMCFSFLLISPTVPPFSLSLALS